MQSVAETEIYELVKTIFDAISDDAPEIEVIRGQRFLSVTVFPTDDTVGQCLGKKGTTATAVRTLVHALAGKHRMRAEFQIEA